VIVEKIRAENVIAEAEARWGSACAGCGADLHGLDVVLSLFLGDKGALRCVGCAARGLGRAPEEFVRGAVPHLSRLECWSGGWRHAEARLRREGKWPARGIPEDVRLTRTEEGEKEQEEEFTAFEAAYAADAASPAWDAGDAACGDLVLELRLKLRAMQPGQILRVRATDPGAPGDLPAWCRLTGHTLLRFRHPEYWIQAKS